MKRITLEEHKKILLDALLYLKDICEENNIRYFLSSGTLLGAVKYKGFIPWDDDIDLFFLRDDYIKLIEILEKKNNDYEILTCHNTKDYYYPFAKLVNKKTRIIDNARKIKKLGVFIDIFPLDNFDDAESYYKKIRFIRNLATRRMKIKNHVTKNNLKKVEFKKIKFKKIKDFIYRFVDFITLPLGVNFWAKKLDRIVQQKSGPMLAALYEDPPKIIESKMFEETALYDFEGHKFTSIKNADKYLKNTYGDYKKDLPLSSQYSHHQVEAFYKDE